MRKSQQELREIAKMVCDTVKKISPMAIRRVFNEKIAHGRRIKFVPEFIEGQSGPKTLFDALAENQVFKILQTSLYSEGVFVTIHLDTEDEVSAVATRSYRTIRIKIQC